MRRLLLVCFFIAPVLVLAQSPVPPQPQSQDTRSSSLPVRRVVLYKTGVGYFEHLGNVLNQQDVTIRFTSAQLNDVLSSLTVLDLGKGQINGISYNSAAPLEQRMGALRLPIDGSTTQAQLLASLRGARVEVTSSAGPVSGRLLSVEQKTRQVGDETAVVDTIAIVTEGGQLRTFELSSSVHVRILERDLREEVGRYLDLVGSTREQDVRNMVISAAGTGERPLFVSYVSEVPIWKSTYRLVVGATGKPLLQGWAIVDNTIGEDWRDVELSLVAGAPQSFIQNLSQPLFGRRPVVPMPSILLHAPQTHQASLGDGAGGLRGVVRDAAGSGIPGATVRLLAPSGVVASAIAGTDGRYEITAPPGTYSLRVELQGFSPLVINDWRVVAGSSVHRDLTLQVGAVSEAATVSADIAGLRRGIGGGSYRPQAPGAAPQAQGRLTGNVYDQLSSSGVQTEAGSLGDLFEYRIKGPITLTKNQSALVPVVNAPIDAEKVSLWTRNSGSGRPLRAVWLHNTSGLTLDGGSLTVIDGNAFAGEALLESIKPGEKRLVSYAVDLGVNLDARREDSPARFVRLRARDGIFTHESEVRATFTYRARNENNSATTLIIEHRLQPGWKLADGQTPLESTADAQRFRVVLPTGKETVFEVREIARDETRVSIADIDEQFLAVAVEAGIPASAIEGAFRPVIEKRAELATLQSRLATYEKESTAIAQDQQRLRENMKALRGSAEEKELLLRYTRALESQETRLEGLRADITRTTGEIDKARSELSARIASVSFDVAVK